MKRVLSLAVMLLVLGAPLVTALDVYVGPQVGPNLGFRWGSGYVASHAVSDPKVNAHARGSFGCFAEFGLWRPFSLQVEGCYTIDGSKVKGMIAGIDTWESFDQNYIETVVLGKLRLGRGRTRLVVVAGPDLRYGVGEWQYKLDPDPLSLPDVYVERYTLDDRRDLGIANWVWGVVAGLGVEIRLGAGYLSQGLRAYLGLTDYYENGPEFRPGSIMYTLGYGFKAR